MSSYSNDYCGGYGIRVRIHNPEGEECITSRKDSSPGDQLTWNNPSGGNCTGMEVRTWKTIVYIESNSGNDFCPKMVTIHTKGSIYKIHEIDSWYDYSTNLLPHNVMRLQYK